MAVIMPSDFINKGSKRQRGWDYFFGKKKYSRRERHITAQMKFFSKAKPVRRGRFLAWK